MPYLGSSSFVRQMGEEVPERGIPLAAANAALSGKLLAIVARYIEGGREIVCIVGPLKFHKNLTWFKFLELLKVLKVEGVYLIGGSIWEKA
ncbi:hypothetical protein HY419_01340 [candidate division WWE3 bacterium]|nr:hypothetical protein [candidate division WWE3 bacterium]